MTVTSYYPRRALLCSFCWNQLDIYSLLTVFSHNAINDSTHLQVDHGIDKPIIVFLQWTIYQIFPKPINLPTMKAKIYKFKR